MIRQQVSSDTTLPVVQVHGNHIELFCTFSTGGTSVNVVSPTMTLTAGGGTGSTVSIPSDSLLVPFSKSGPGTGKYRVSFLGGDWLADGEYLLELSGKYPTITGDTLSISGTFTARAAGSIQGYIELLRASLHDYDGSLYYIEDQENFLFSDGQLYTALTRALDQINMAKPQGYQFTMANVPWPGLLIDGGVIYALAQRGILEIANEFNYSDEISFGIARGQKYQSMLQVFQSTWRTTLLQVKQDYAFSRAFPIGMGQTRIPYVFARIFSFSPQIQGLFFGT